MSGGMTVHQRPPERALILHFTHIDNMASIVARGGLVADSAAPDSGLVRDVGDQQVKARRRHLAVPGGPGGKVSDYVPFYYAPRSPMMFRIACDHRDGVAERYGNGEDPLVYIVSSVDQVIEAGLGWTASDGNCAASVSRYCDTIGDLRNLVDWQLMRQTMWSNTAEDPDRQRRRMAEFLVHLEFPLALATGYVVRRAERREQLQAVLAGGGLDAAYIAVRPTWYYGYEPRR